MWSGEIIPRFQKSLKRVSVKKEQSEMKYSEKESLARPGVRGHLPYNLPIPGALSLSTHHHPSGFKPKALADRLVS